MKKLGNILIGGSSFFFLETAFEMYVLTIVRGPQMLGFWMVHTARVFLILVVLSGFSYMCLAAFALFVLASKWFGKVPIEDRHARLMSIVLSIQLIHTSLLLTYDYWSPLLVRKGG